jgi:hypothetical protein
MKRSTTNIASKATTLVENHSLVASLLAVLCLAFAVNYFLVGPGSDGGSGFGGTGKAGGESGFGGTGKGPDMSPGFKLGANDQDSANGQDSLTDTLPGFEEFRDGANSENSLAMSLPALASDNGSIPQTPEFDISMLKLTPQPDFLAEITPDNRSAESVDTDISSIVETISLVEVKVIDEVKELTDFDSLVGTEINQLADETLLSSLDILNRLMLVEAQAKLLESTASNNSAIDGDTQGITDLGNERIALADNTIRNRIALPARPERPDRLNVPARIAPVQRVNIPSPPPVRPMRTLSTILNR